MRFMNKIKLQRIKTDDSGQTASKVLGHNS